jgi:hypothetical protein
MVKIYIILLRAWDYTKKNKNFISIMFFFLFIPFSVYLCVNWEKICTLTWDSYTRIIFPLWIGLLSVGLGSVIYLKFDNKKSDSLDTFLCQIINVFADANRGDKIEIIFPSFNPGVAKYVKNNRKYHRYEKFTGIVKSKLKDGISVEFYIISTDFNKWNDICTNQNKYKTAQNINAIEDDLIKFLCGNVSFPPTTDRDTDNKNDKQISDYFFYSAKFLNDLLCLKEHGCCQFKFLRKEFANTKIISIVDKNKNRIFIGSYLIDEDDKDFNCHGETIDNKLAFDALFHCMNAIIDKYAYN